MNVTFNTLEVLEIAEEIERNGAQFYRRAAEILDGSYICKTFIRLADWEIKHEQVFARMRKQLSDLNQEPKTQNSEDTLPDPKVMAGLAVFGIRPNPADELSGKESKVDIIKKGIEKEKDSIVFYNGLKDFVPTEAGKDKIDDIIKEEMRHIRILNRFCKRIK
jgi:rubrerythrin